MKNLISAVLGIAVISFVLGIISRLILRPIPIAPGGGMEAEAFLTFTNTCLLIAITLILLRTSRDKL